MPNNFGFIHDTFSAMREYALGAERHVYTDPMYSAIQSRKCLELYIKWLYDNDEDLELPYDTTLNSLMHEPSFRAVIPATMFRNINLLRKIGNNAAHSSQKILPRESLDALKILFDFSRWVQNVYTTATLTAAQFDEGLLQKGEPVARNNKEREALQAKYEDTTQQLDRANKKLLENEAALAELQRKLQQVQDIKQANLQYVTPGQSITEAETRKIYIDTLLKEAGWDLTLPDVIEYELQGMPNSQGIGYADYVLWGDDGKPLAVVEAKKTTVNTQDGKRQAELYANCLQQMTGQRPVIFFTNGFDTYIWDDAAGYPDREVQGFYSKDELQLLVNRRTSQKPLNEVSFNKDIAGRYYQEEAIKRVAEALDKKNRGTLLVMATGSGKTRTAAAIVDMLAKANWAKKILFLADRNALVTQAKNNFNSYLPNMTAIDLTKEAEDVSSRIVFSTYPTMMNKIDSVKSEGHRYYGVGHFDLVVIDEAHRSVYMKYRAIFEYFDAIFIGLTATPKSDTDKDTYELFGLESHNPTYAYELDLAVGDKYLVPPKGIKLPLAFPARGIKYQDLSDEDKARYEKDFLESYGYMPEEVSGGAVNQWLFNKDTVDKVLLHLMENGLKTEGGDKLGKSVIFARNHDHALYIEERFNKLFPEYRGKMLRIIDNHQKYPQNLIDEFSRKDNHEFLIAVSVDMLDTGIDIPEILNLVFFKPVRSKAKFWQMVGRGTRLCPDIFGPGLDKEFFYIFDVCGNLDFFTANIKEVEAPLVVSLSQRIFLAQLHILQSLQDKKGKTDEEQEYLNYLRDALCNTVQRMPESDFRVKAKLRYVHKYNTREAWESLSDLEINDLGTHLSPLALDDKSDEEARRFDYLMLKIIEAIIEGEAVNNNKVKVQESVKGLLKVTRIREVKDKEPLIRAVLEDEYWQQMSISKCEQLRADLRGLMKYIEKEQKRNLYTDIKDEFTGNIEEVDILFAYSDLAAYKKRVEKYIRENQHHLTIQKLRTNKPITKSELAELEKLLLSIEAGQSAETLAKVTNGQPVGAFIRSIVGLDINAAKEAFALFLNDKNLSPAQIQFVNMIIDYLAENGVIENKILFEPPFTNLNDQGIAGIFNTTQSSSIINVLRQINTNAFVAA